MKSQFRTWHFALALALIAALCLMSVAALANGQGKAPKMEPSKRVHTPAVMGRGPTTVTLTTVTASSAGNCAWIYTTLPMTCAPVQTTGLIQATAIKAPVGAHGMQMRDNANVIATFNYPNSGCTYTVQFTGLASAGEFNAPFGGVVIEKSFGEMTMWGVEFPRTMAYAAVVGRATIMRNNEVVATNEPAIVAVTHAIHDQSNRLMSEADPSREEMHLFVPGSLIEGGTAVTGFPKGWFYIYWPSATHSISKEQITIPGETIGAGPAEVTKGSLHIELRNSGIHKTVGSAPFGLYEITVRNSSDKWQGLYMTGTDICCTEYKRFSKILKPGATQKFRWFFAPGKVVMRPFCCAVKVPTSYDDYKWTGPATSVVFE